jgi:periplasmic divalent cation tolerance protein
MTEACLIMSTCGSEEAALNIAAALVDQKLAACVSFFPVKSYYYYNGETHIDEEVKLNIKTCSHLFDEVAELITEMHEYDVPEIIMLNVEKAS